MKQLRNALVEQQIQKRAEQSFYNIEGRDCEYNKRFQIGDERIDSAASFNNLVKRHFEDLTQTKGTVKHCALS